MSDPVGRPISLSTSTARSQLSEIVRRVQDPRVYCVLTRHGKPVAAVVSIADLKRQFNREDVEMFVRGGASRAHKFYQGPGQSIRTKEEAADAVLQMQMNRRDERAMLASAGLDPVPGGELMEEAPVAQPVWWKRVWWRWRASSLRGARPGE